MNNIALSTLIMKKISIISVLALTLYAISCTKDKDKTDADRLQGKWYMTDSHGMLYFNGNSIPQNDTYYVGEFTAEFKGNLLITDGRLGRDSGTYKLIDGPKMITGSDTTDIINLTDSTFSFSYTDRSIPGNVLQQTDNYKKYK